VSIHNRSTPVDSDALETVKVFEEDATFKKLLVLYSKKFKIKELYHRF